MIFASVSCDQALSLEDNVSRELNKKGRKWERLGPGGGGSTFQLTFADHSSDMFALRCDMTGSI